MTVTSIQGAVTTSSWVMWRKRITVTHVSQHRKIGGAFILLLAALR